MIINTRDFGQIEVSKKELLTFPAGVFAFEDLRTFALISPLGEDVYPKWLQSTDGTAPCFIVFDPAMVDTQYNEKNIAALEHRQLRLIKADENSPNNAEVSFLLIATVPSDFKKTTINMKAPVVVNYTERLAAQVILENDYDVKFPLYAPDAPESETAGDE